MRERRYETLLALASGDRSPSGCTGPGPSRSRSDRSRPTQLSAHIRVFLDFRGDKIRAQRNHDCYDRG
jgi:hypothetical protein